MIESLIAQDFQAHVFQRVDFDERITTITGPSDVGKSALLRLLRWVSLNQPGGDGFIREGAKDAVGTLVIDGRTIKRCRGKGGNLYYLDGSEFKAFGNTVPDAIAEILNVSQINFQGQHDPVYWFAETAGEVSRQLNAVVDLGVIDESLSAIAGRVDHYRSVAKVSRDRLDKVRQKKAEIDWAVEADKQYQEVESLACKLSQQTTYNSQLRQAAQCARDTQNQRDTARQQVLDVRAVGVLGSQALRLEKSRDLLQESIQDIRIQKKILDKGVPDISQLADYSDRYQRLDKQHTRLSYQLSTAKDQQAIVSRGYPDMSNLTELKNRFEGLLKKRQDLKNQLEQAGEYRGIVRDFPDVTGFETNRQLVENYQARKKIHTQLEDLAKEIRQSYIDLKEAEIEAKLAEKTLQQETQGLCPVCGKELS